MALKIQESVQDNSLIIEISDRFDFSLHQQFRESYVNREQSGLAITLDLNGTSYMDSSALGMILLLKDHVEKLSGSLKIAKPSDAVYKILEIAQFQRLIAIER